MGRLIHDRDPMSEPTRAQEQACERLAYLHASVECWNLPNGEVEATLWDEDPKHGAQRIAYVALIAPDGTPRRRERRNN